MDQRNFTEPMFVFAMMVMAGTRPILQACTLLVSLFSRTLPFPFSPTQAFYFSLLGFVPLLGSLITEPAAMTLAALLLRERFFRVHLSERFKYATLGVLFVNISIGGTLTSFAAPPVLMVAHRWHWDSYTMMHLFGWKALIAVFINALGISLFFHKEIRQLTTPTLHDVQRLMAPTALILMHILFMIGLVIFSEHPALFMGLFLLFLGLASAYQRHQDRLILREGLLVAFFLAGLVVLGEPQHWWLQPLLIKMSSQVVFWGAMLLTALTDNAALTYLGSLVPNLSDSFKYSLVAGAITGGGLTVIANAPNPVGVAILSPFMRDLSIHPLKLLLAALPPTLVAVLVFYCL